MCKDLIDRVGSEEEPDDVVGVLEYRVAILRRVCGRRDLDEHGDAVATHAIGDVRNEHARAPDYHPLPALFRENARN